MKKISTRPAASTKHTNPKDACGSRKVQISTIPETVLVMIAAGMTEGARKYGRHNYRVKGVRASVYYDAAMRHLLAWYGGENMDKDSGLPHVAKAITSLCVLLDAMLCAKWVDDRPPKSNIGRLIELMNLKTEALIEKYPEPKVPYTELTIRKRKIARKIRFLKFIRR